jgi:diguanylate cyclase (GGDEF)-like protein
MPVARFAEATIKASIIEIVRTSWVSMLLLVLALTTLYFFLEQRQLRETEQANASLLATGIADHLQHNEQEQIQSLITELTQNGRLLSVAIYDKQAAPVLGWTYLNQFAATKQLPQTALVKQIQSDLQLAQLNIAVPVLKHDEMIGKIQLSISLGKLYLHAILFGLLSALMVGLASLLAAFKLAQRQAERLRPIYNLSLVAEQIASLNDYSLRVNIHELPSASSGRQSSAHSFTHLFHTLITHFNDIIARVDSWESDRQAEIRERMEAERRLDILANHDSLTKLPNRKYFQILIQDCMDEAVLSQQLAALMFIDLHQFKMINALLGYDAGDLILSTISNRIYAVLRNTDTLCRVDGDEFAAILPNIDSKEMAVHLAERLLHEINQPMSLRGRKIIVAAQIGIACCPLHGSELRPFLRKTDDALKLAKSLGPNHIQLAQC